MTARSSSDKCLGALMVLGYCEILERCGSGRESVVHHPKSETCRSDLDSID